MFSLINSSSPPFSRKRIRTSPSRSSWCRQTIQLPEVEADAIARPDTVINPVDLGTILVPSGWLLLGPKQSATLDFAAINRGADLPKAQLSASFDSSPATVASTTVDLTTGRRTQLRLKLPDAPPAGDRDVLSVVLKDSGGRTLWRKGVPVMLVRESARDGRASAPPTNGCGTMRRSRSASQGPGRFSSLPYEGALGAQPARRRRLASEWSALCLLAGVQLYPVLGGPA